MLPPNTRRSMKGLSSAAQFAGHRAEPAAPAPVITSRYHEPRCGSSSRTAALRPAGQRNKTTPMRSRSSLCAPVLQAPRMGSSLGKRRQPSTHATADKGMLIASGCAIHRDDQQPPNKRSDHCDGLRGNRQDGEHTGRAVLAGAVGLGANQPHRRGIASAGAEAKYETRAHDQHRQIRSRGTDHSRNPH